MSNKIYILGPCAAESEDQVMAVAKELAKLINANENVNVNANDNEEEGRGTIFRSGIWKPRTSPNT
ncbi:MAG: hypothetical protein MJZ20_12575, partial [Bacteroidaceae bacterium]|nr:hypothetical protein [Bacteroidaceae bacterium]